MILPCLVEAFKIVVLDRVQWLRPLLRTFQLVPWVPAGKSAKLGPHSESELSADFTPSTLAAYVDSDGTPMWDDEDGNTWWQSSSSAYEEADKKTRMLFALWLVVPPVQ